jgi:thiamine biosynthesis protein ThiI
VSSVVVRYAELALKGRNRPWFINTLVRTLRNALADLDVVDVRALMGRIEIRLGPAADWADVRERLRRLPGVGNFSRAMPVGANLDAITTAVLAELPGRAPATFRISARRADKRFALPSPEIERLVGRSVQDATGWRVDLSRPDLTIYIEVLTDGAFVFCGKERGAGGLPVGTSGKVMCLLSGGIDSPVAAWRLIRRGCRAHFVHFHSYPIVSMTSQEKARDIVARLTMRQLRSRLFLVPFGGVQQQVVVNVPPPLRVVVYRRLMVRIAERLARRSGAHALVTGDVVGQVASQTIENLTAIEGAATMPILRPLIGFDKDEITLEAQALGTYEISIIPDEDCCTLFTPRFPATRAARGAAEAAEASLDIELLVERAAADAVVQDFQYPVIRSAAGMRPGAGSGDRA